MDAKVKTSPSDNAHRPSRKRPARAEAEAAVRLLLAYTGDDPDREGLRDTPARVVRAYDELFAGYSQDREDALARVFEDVGGYDDMVLVGDIPFISHCEHHMAPFVGKAHVAYFPGEGVVGLSKIARLVDLYARRLQTQENMTAQIADAMEDCLKPRGVAVMVSAEHMCMSMRGVRKSGAQTVTMRFLGLFRDNPNQQMRFMQTLQGFRG